MSHYLSTAVLLPWKGWFFLKSEASRRTAAVGDRTSQEETLQFNWKIKAIPTPTVLLTLNYKCISNILSDKPKFNTSMRQVQAKNTEKESSFALFVVSLVWYHVLGVVGGQLTPKGFVNIELAFVRWPERQMGWYYCFVSAGGLSRKMLFDTLAQLHLLKANCCDFELETVSSPVVGLINSRTLIQYFSLPKDLTCIYSGLLFMSLATGDSLSPSALTSSVFAAAVGLFLCERNVRFPYICVHTWPKLILNLMWKLPNCLCSSSSLSAEVIIKLLRDTFSTPVFRGCRH